MTSALNNQSLDQIFRSAHTPNGWTDCPVEDRTVREIYDLLKWGPTSANSSPARFVWVRSADGKATLAGLAAEPNKPKILKAPVTVVIGHDLDFAGELPKLLRKRGKSRGGGMIIRFPGVHESDSLWEWCCLQTLMIFRRVI